MAKTPDNGKSLSLQMMSRAMTKVADKYEDEDARQAAKELWKLSEKPEEK